MNIVARFRFLFHQFLSLRGKNFLGAPVKFCMFDQPIAIREPRPAQRATVRLLSLTSDNEGETGLQSQIFEDLTHRVFSPVLV